MTEHEGAGPTAAGAGPAGTGPTAAGPTGTGPSAARSLGAMWVYSVLRFGLFLVVWGVLWLVRVPTLLAGIIAVVLSVPLSLVLLNRQRQKLADNLEQRVEHRRTRTQNLDEKLSGGEAPLEDEIVSAGDLVLGSDSEALVRSDARTAASRKGGSGNGQYVRRHHRSPS